MIWDLMKQREERAKAAVALFFLIARNVLERMFFGGELSALRAKNVMHPVTIQ
jgi:hypothetical protein